MALTDKRIRGLKPAATDYEESDNGPGGRRGLYLVIAATGRKYFRARVMVDGRSRREVFSPDYPDLSLVEARETFDDYRRARKQRGTTQSTDARRMTVKDLLDEWDRAYLQKHRKDPAAVRRAIEKDVLPDLGDELLSAISRRDLVLAIDRVQERGSERMADQVRSFIVQMFGFAVSRGLLDDTPARLLKKEKRGRHAATRKRVLDDEELRAFWWATATDPATVPAAYRAKYLPRVTPYTKRALRVLLLTGMRRSEVVNAHWSEIDTAAGVWTVPASRTKSGRELVLPIPDLALEILEEQRTLTGGYDFVFASPKADFAAPMLPSAVSQAIRDNVKKITREAFVPHDLRRTVRSRLAALGVNSVIARKVLNHVLDGMDAVYDRHDYLDEKRDALQRWANELRAILDGAGRKVVALRVAAG